jgi:hypothetical protein
MKIILSALIAAYSISVSAYEVERGYFSGCAKKGDCVSEECTKVELMKHEGNLPLFKCKKVSKVDPKTKEKTLYFYEITVKSYLPAKSVDECPKNNPGCTDGPIEIKLMVH